MATTKPVRYDADVRDGYDGGSYEEKVRKRDDEEDKEDQE
jgi:hypothetical protein